MNFEEMTANQLHDLLNRLAEKRRAEGRGKSPEAYQARHYCKVMKAKVRRELRRRKLPSTRPGDKRVYGPGQAAWQKAGG